MRIVRESRIEGDFEGWDGETIYELRDGTKWQQVRYMYRYRYRYSPPVKIVSDGSRYYMIVEDDEPVQVRRVD